MSQDPAPSKPIPIDPPPANILPPSPEQVFSRRLMVTVTTALAAVLLAILIYYTAAVLTILFASVLLAVFLSTPADFIASRTRIPRGGALVIVMFALFTFFSLFGFSLGQTVYTQVRQLQSTLPGAMHALQEDVKHSPWLQRFAPQPMPVEPATATDPSSTDPATGPTTAPAQDEPGIAVAGLISKGEDLILRLVESDTFLHTGQTALNAGAGVVGTLMLIFIIGLFITIAPSSYITGFVALFPIAKRPRARQILSGVGASLQWWFVGQIGSMFAVGTLTFIGLLILGVPAALTLAMLSGLMTFIPNFGPIIAAIPAILIALAPHGAQTQINGFLALYVIILYFLVQFADGWVITPLIQRRAAHLPPALIVLAQVTLLLLLGWLGVLLATPILASIIVIIRMSYIEDVLGDRTMHHKAGPLEGLRR